MDNPSAAAATAAAGPRCDHQMHAQQTVARSAAHSLTCMQARQTPEAAGSRRPRDSRPCRRTGPAAPQSRQLRSRARRGRTPAGSRAPGRLPRGCRPATARPLWCASPPPAMNRRECCQVSPLPASTNGGRLMPSMGMIFGDLRCQHAAGRLVHTPACSLRGLATKGAAKRCRCTAAARGSPLPPSQCPELNDATWGGAQRVLPLQRNTFAHDQAQ